MGDLDIYYQSGGMVNPTLAREYATGDLKKKFEELMSIIQNKLEQTNYTQEDANIIALSLNELYMLQKKGGFEYSMNDTTILLFALFKATGYDPMATKPNLNVDLKSLQAIKDRGITFDNKTLSMKDIIAILDIKNFAQAGNTLADATLSFVHWAYDGYSKEVEKLAESVEAAKNVIGNLNSLQGILNHVQGNKVGDYKYPAEKWSDIPVEFQNKLKAEFPAAAYKIDWNKMDDPKAFEKLNAYLKIPPWSKTYGDWSDNYFKKQLESTPTPQAGDIPAVLNMRDNLIRQMAILKKGGAPTGDGTPYDTISKLVDTINAQFPQSTYPPLIPNADSPADRTKDLRAGKDWNAEFGGAPFSFDKINKQKYPLAQNQITAWIKSGQGDGKTNELLGQALNANQRLSDDMSKNLQAKNQLLTQIMDMLTQLIDAVHKILSGTAQKIARG